MNIDDDTWALFTTERDGDCICDGENADDKTTQALLRLWVEHRSEGIRRGIAWRHDWETAPDWAHREADEWVAKDAAFRLLIGTRLADAALEEFEEDA